MSRYNIPRLRARDLTIRLVGHPYASIGMGEHVRSVWRALQQVGVQADIVDIYGPTETPDPTLVAEFGGVMSARLGDGVNIFCINGDEVEQALSKLRHRRPMAPGSCNVIYPAWELERYPEPWAEQLMRFDEVWAPSAFIRNAVSKAVSIPVLHMPLACEVGPRALLSRRYFGIRESAYAFLFSFDYLSYIERKNPFAVIKAFELLLREEPHADAVLVIKTSNGCKRSDMQSRFNAAIAPLRDRVVVIDRTLSELEMKSLIWLTDCFVSLHRSEGFGRGLTEAMALGKPVIATAYSGNMDFCTEDTAFLIPYELVPVGPGEYPHWENQCWADPDPTVAAAAMRVLVKDLEIGYRIGAQARLHILLRYGYLPVGLTYLERINKICESSVLPLIANGF